MLRQSTINTPIHTLSRTQGGGGNRTRGLLITWQPLYLLSQASAFVPFHTSTTSAPSFRALRSPSPSLLTRTIKEDWSDLSAEIPEESSQVRRRRINLSEGKVGRTFSLAVESFIVKLIELWKDQLDHGGTDFQIQSRNTASDESQ